MTDFDQLLAEHQAAKQKTSKLDRLFASEPGLEDKIRQALTNGSNPHEIAVVLQKLYGRRGVVEKTLRSWARDEGFPV